MLGLLAGAGRFPVYIAEMARAKGFRVTAVAPTVKIEPDLENHVDKIRTYKFARLKEFFDILEQERIKKAVMAGKIDKRWIYEPDVEVDQMALDMMKKAPDMKDDTIMFGFLDALEQRGVEIMAISELGREWLAPRGSFSKYAPDEGQLKDIEFGFKVAKEIGRIDIGQTVAVLRLAVLAVEAIEGTDLAIIRAGQISPGAVVVKIMRPGQSLKFDVPVVGVNTVQAMVQANASVLAVEAGKCLVVEREEMVALADQNHIALFGV
jgi:UDP-2,3-diacylglucosamine hydrolase